ncbi:hypothetical protein FHS07_001211 [Microbacterium proteolyticum]|uniref:Uncharacterized protein n=1 Tax=Microbacterium proteolyticum TaxID=1572644 RepID=A0A7W5GFS8_9MICO|nr:hypothetical protein [Microbacterium proteolyticum]MBB3157527.1 hypothetical protein [Microbacterium proteolyticum]
MPDLAWAVPAAIALVAAALVVAIVVIAVRVHRRSSRARAAAGRAVSGAASALLALDDDVDDLDLAFEAADALDADDVPTELRRARTTAHRARDRGFGDLLVLEDYTGVAARRRDQARRLREGLDAQREQVSAVRARLADWQREHRSPAGLLAAARHRRDDLVAMSGDPEPLVDALRARFDDADWSEAAVAASRARRALADADDALGRAETDADGDHVVRATAELRRAARHLREVEDGHRVALQAAGNAEAEVAAARAEIDEAIHVATSRPEACPPGAADRLRAAADELNDAAAAASRRPREAVATVARVREERDAILGDAVSMRRRVEAARTALPGTLACARAALAAAETASATADEKRVEARIEARGDAAPEVDRITRRLRVERARRHLAEARAATDATQALTAARAAWSALR